MSETADSISDDKIRALAEHLRQVKRKNAYHRAILKDCDGALAGSRACRESVATAWNKRTREAASW